MEAADFPAAASAAEAAEAGSGQRPREVRVFSSVRKINFHLTTVNSVKSFAVCKNNITLLLMSIVKTFRA